MKMTAFFTLVLLLGSCASVEDAAPGADVVFEELSSEYLNGYLAFRPVSHDASRRPLVMRGSDYRPPGPHCSCSTIPKFSTTRRVNAHDARCQGKRTREVRFVTGIRHPDKLGELDPRGPLLMTRGVRGTGPERSGRSWGNWTREVR